MKVADSFSARRTVFYGETMMKTSLKIIAASLALVAGQVQAINVGGVVWDPDSFFDFTSTDTMYESAIVNVGDVVTGYGKILSFNGTGESTFCPGCELTYSFTYTLANNTGGLFSFTGGLLNVYVDNTPDWNPLNMGNATDGTLFLSLTGHSYLDVSTGRIGTLHSDPTPSSVGLEGDGRGYLDVAGGIAAGNFDTNSIAVVEDATGRIGYADFLFTSSFQLLPNGSFVTSDGQQPVLISMFGSNDLQGRSIPEPASLVLAGLGLIGLGVARRRKN